MANEYTTADVNQVLNNPGIFYFRAFGSTGSYTKAVFTNASEFSFTPEITTVGFDDTGEVFDAIGKETGEVKFSFGKPFDLDFMSSLSGGLYTKTVTSAGAQAVVNQTIAAGWGNKTPITINLIDTSDIRYIANGEPAITSVTASSSGALAANDDYSIVADENSYSGYSIVLNSAGTATVATTESIVIIYNDPTVIGQTTMSGGGIKNYDPIEGYFDTILKDGTTAKVNFYRGFYNGNINLPFGTEDSPEAAVTDVVISLKKDTSRTAGDQVFSLVKG